MLCLGASDAEGGTDGGADVDGLEAPKTQRDMGGGTEEEEEEDERGRRRRRSASRVTCRRGGAPRRVMRT